MYTKTAITSLSAVVLLLLPAAAPAQAAAGGGEGSVVATSSAEEVQDKTVLPPGGTDRRDSVPGMPIDGFYDEPGDWVGVAGLAPWEAPLEARAEPFEGAEVVGELDSTDAMILAGRQIGHPTFPEEDHWAEVKLADGYAWVPTQHLLFFGAYEDMTDDYIDDVGEYPTEYQAAEAVVDTVTDGVDGKEGQIITTPEGTGEAFYRADITGVPDTSIAGNRIFFWIEEAEAGYTVKKIDGTTLCRRGVSEEGLCV